MSSQNSPSETRGPWAHRVQLALRVLLDLWGRLGHRAYRASQELWGLADHLAFLVLQEILGPPGRRESKGAEGTKDRKGQEENRVCREFLDRKALKEPPGRMVKMERLELRARLVRATRQSSLGASNTSS